MKKKIILLIVLSAILFSIGGCILPPPWPDRDERHDRDRDHGRDHDRDGRYDHDRGYDDHGRY